uniref:Metalloendopeptidase n=1 Tax=Heterorhabditis bacteriophora TaxID=37862 RepID=A0A1I7XD50_HETBA
MAIYREQLEALERAQSTNGSGRSKRQASTIYRKWTDGNVYYYFDETIDDRKRTAIAAAINYIQSRTCINFIESSTARSRIKFITIYATKVQLFFSQIINGPGCQSFIGMTGREQTLMIGDGCTVIGTIAHEFNHALGFRHMQSRYDRDDYVTVDTTNVKKENVNNFVKTSEDDSKNFTPYEYGSFMHYSANAFTTKEGTYTIVPNDTDYVYTMGNRMISFYDMQMINEHYGCNTKCSVGRSARCENGGIPNPRNCNVCNCPIGYGGDYCDERPSGCGGYLKATENWQSNSLSFGDSSSQDVRDTFTTCHHWVLAPKGKTIQVKITSMRNSQCQFGCPFNGIEIKGKADKKITNPKSRCSSMASEGFCTWNSAEVVKQYCAKTCSLCGTTSTTVAPTTTSQICRDMLSGSDCAKLAEWGFCTNGQYNTSVIKMNCAKTCKLCDNSAVFELTTASTTATSECKNMIDDASCESQAQQGFCTNTRWNDVDTIKYYCAKTCNLCGIAKNPCRDKSIKCSAFKSFGKCTSLNKFTAEYHCAATCGFCQNPA